MPSDTLTCDVDLDGVSRECGVVETPPLATCGATTRETEESPEFLYAGIAGCGLPKPLEVKNGGEAHSAMHTSASRGASAPSSGLQPQAVPGALTREASGHARPSWIRTKKTPSKKNFLVSGG